MLIGLIPTEVFAANWWEDDSWQWRNYGLVFDFMSSQGGVEVSGMSVRAWVNAPGGSRAYTPWEPYISGAEYKTRIMASYGDTQFRLYSRVTNTAPTIAITNPTSTQAISGAGTISIS